MCAQTSLNEKRVLIFSALLASGFAVGGLVLGTLVGSLVIVFDGVYSSVSLVLTLLSLAVSKYIQSPSRHHFPFGKAVLEPVVIAVKGSVILIIVSYSLYSAVLALFTGGREVDASIASLFGAINVVGCGYAWWHIAMKSKRFSSGLIQAEVKQWQMDTLLSVAVTLGFVLAWAITLSPFESYAVYADPMMMILMSFYFIKVPADMLRGSIREMLMMAPSTDILDVVDREVDALDKQVKQHIEVDAVTKVGRELRVSLNVHSDDKQLAIADIEKTRRILSDKLSKLPLDLRLNLNIAT
ncbi:cobalt-zinc-cadmium resistance protein [Vibrio zhanjiangensis]|uniref:Cobalt-zinc-cadmium resistance protein n=1 Tax=Vibrio zhanjiangensis TaxID=1046128 RepID=A0ABQ6F5H7_9VIBR|nr:cation transporter [Vibrio zhanjiangensis]GLT20071.1 cobalt-zinc-cadmium resistance protein [Vibrio zhanjiangensis]